MKREVVVGYYCQKCESVMALTRSDCICMRDIPEYATKRWRENYWHPLYWRAEVTMRKANRA